MSRPRITILDPETASKIAAGEVVESPASVVKELVENALDAQAKRVVVEIRGGGTDYIRVQDDGLGMEPDEARLAFYRHATSKIRGAEDLYALKTLGFRGEALPSIAAVARVEMVTRAQGAPLGSRLCLEGGKEIKIEEAGCAEGTTITVTDLFYNTPARRRFLKGPAREAAKVVTVVERMALAHPEVSFHLIVDGRRLLATPGNNDLRSAISAVWGLELGESLMLVEGELGEAVYRGFVSPPWLHRSNRHYQVLVVNGRYIISNTFTREIEDVYSGLIPNERYPIFVLHMLLPPNWLDVNVHPTKLVVRIKDEELLARSLGKILATSLRNPEAVAPAGVQHLAPPSSAATLTDAWYVAEQESFDAYAEQEVRGAYNGEDRGEDVVSSPYSEGGVGLQVEALPPLHVVGQLFNTYILAEGPDALYIIDQHAAHERIRFHELKLRWSKAGVAGQIVEPPRILRLNASQALELKTASEFWTKWGFKIEPFGANAFLLREVPYGTPVGKEVEVLEEALTKGWDKLVRETEDALLKIIACHGAIKAGQSLSREEMEELLAKLSQSLSPYTCPHGRPAIVKIDAKELYKYFSRPNVNVTGEGGAAVFGKRRG